MSNSKNKIAVIGLGNLARRDDGIGIRILENLIKDRKNDAIDYYDFGIASFDLIHKIGNYANVILIDGINNIVGAGGRLPLRDRKPIQPGDLLFFNLSDIENMNIASPISTHELNLHDLHQLCQNLDIKTNIFIAGIQVGDMSYGDGFSDNIDKNIRDITNSIADYINRI